MVRHLQQGFPVADDHGLFEPVARLGDLFQLCAVTGEVVGNHGLKGETFHGGEQGLECGLQSAALEATQGIGTVDPTGGQFGKSIDQAGGDFVGGRPFMPVSIDVPELLEHRGKLALLGRDGFEFQEGFGGAAEFHPPFGGLELQQRGSA